MKPLNVVFPENQKEFIESLASDIGVSKSVLSRAAMQVGLDTIAQLTAQDKSEGKRYTLINEAVSKDC